MGVETEDGARKREGGRFLPSPGMKTRGSNPTGALNETGYLKSSTYHMVRPRIQNSLEFTKVNGSTRRRRQYSSRTERWDGQVPLTLGTLRLGESTGWVGTRSTRDRRDVGTLL